MADMSQMFLLIATFDIALISIAIANFAVSASYLGREARLSRKRMEKRKKQLGVKLDELRKKGLQIDTIQKELDEAKKDIGKLRDRLFLLSWHGAVVVPSVCYLLSLFFAIIGMNLDSLALNLSIQAVLVIAILLLSAGFIFLMVVVKTIDSAAKEIPMPVFEVSWEDSDKKTIGETAKIKPNVQTDLWVSIYNSGEDLAENVEMYATLPSVFKVKEATHLQVDEMPAEDTLPKRTDLFYEIGTIHINKLFRIRITLKALSGEKKIYPIAVTISERKIGESVHKLAIKVMD